MPTVGETLRGARERKGLSLNDIADQTRIATRYLQAIEADDLANLPGGFFYRNWVKQYAGVVGVPSDTLLNQVVSAESSVATAAPVRSTSSTSTFKLSEPAISNQPATEYNPLADRRSAGRPFLYAAALIVVAVGCAGIYALWERQSRPPENQPDTASAAQTSPAATAPAPTQSQPTPGATPAANATPDSQPAPAQATPSTPVSSTPTPSTTAPEPSTPAPSASDSTLVVSAKGDVWFRFTTADGKSVDTVLKAGESKSFPNVQSARVKFGNAGGVEVTWKGKPVGTIGPAGQIRTLVVSPDKVEILAPAPKPEEPRPAEL